MKFFALLLVFISSCFIALPAIAANSDVGKCRTYDGHQICVVSKKRSSKRYWNFRVVTSTDGKENPEEIYNCRGKFKILDGKISSFAQSDPVEFICPSLKK
ncbi:MAG: hypothetical protein AAF208_10495 [Cyanobacteria bacterium P01_A01_bin.45]